MHTIRTRPLRQLHPLTKTHIRSRLLTNRRTVRNPKLADQYAAVEAATGHMFRADLSMADIVAEARGHQTQLSLLELAEIA